MCNNSLRVTLSRFTCACFSAITYRSLTSPGPGYGYGRRQGSSAEHRLFPDRAGHRSGQPGQQQVRHKPHVRRDIRAQGKRPSSCPVPRPFRSWGLLRLKVVPRTFPINLCSRASPAGVRFYSLWIETSRTVDRSGDSPCSHKTRVAKVWSDMRTSKWTWRTSTTTRPYSRKECTGEMWLKTEQPVREKRIKNSVFFLYLPFRTCFVSRRNTYITRDHDVLSNNNNKNSYPRGYIRLPLNVRFINKPFTRRRIR